MEYALAAVVAVGAEASGEAPDSGVDLCSAVVVGANGPDVRAQPIVASTTTGDRRAVRASGRGRERKSHFSWGKGAERVRTADGDASLT
ncbi:hypothetical protein N7U49_37735 [Streptomyces sp. AD2-2]|nr:hypothetical protein N7U49_37735 [Streptomyces sp. AD2-2]